MPLFRDENPALGPSTVLKELSGFGAGSPVVNYFKPTTREIIQTPFAAAPTSGWVYVAPFKCQVISIKAVYTVAGGASCAIDVKNFTQAAQPLAPSTAANGTTVVDQQSATLPLTGAANTVYAASLSTAAGSPNVLNPGDMLGYTLSGTVTGLAGGVLQVEVAQIG